MKSELSFCCALPAVAVWHDGLYQAFVELISNTLMPYPSFLLVWIQAHWLGVVPGKRKHAKESSLELTGLQAAGEAWILELRHGEFPTDPFWATISSLGLYLYLSFASPAFQCLSFAHYGVIVANSLDRLRYA